MFCIKICFFGAGAEFFYLEPEPKKISGASWSRGKMAWLRNSDLCNEKIIPTATCVLTFFICRFFGCDVKIRNCYRNTALTHFNLLVCNTSRGFNKMGARRGWSGGAAWPQERDSRGGGGP